MISTKKLMWRMISGFVDIAYPVGSYYETSNGNFNPNTRWGGTWVLETAGLVHVSAGTGYAVSGANASSGKGSKDGGDKNAIIPYHNHGVPAVSIASSGSHTHTFQIRTIADKVQSGTSLSRIASTGSNWESDVVRQTNGSASGGHTHTVPSHTTNTVGTSGNTTNANMQPYINVYRWHRTA